ncbi:MAG: hypothetical protein KKB37_00350 [Alphaproteobacteria bacterium]|nr:hypothetical protein [Alphaproteobacteria bacterium]
MTDAQELALIQRDIDETRQRIALDRRLLADQLVPHGGGPDVVDELLTLCDEFGATEVQDRLATLPGSFQLSALPAGRLAVVAQLLHQLTDTGDDFDSLVTARENILCRLDTTRARVYPWFGREFQIDADKHALHFADAPALPEPMMLETVPNRAPPRLSPDAETKPQRQNRRDRKR